MLRQRFSLSSSALSTSSLATGVLLTTAIVCHAAMFFSHKYNAFQNGTQNLFFNSDALQIPALFEDVVTQGHSFRDWYLSPAPFFFPDWAVYATAHLVGRTMQRAVCLVGVLQLLLTWFVLRHLFSGLFSKPASTAATNTSFGLLAILSLLEIKPAAYSLVTVYHYGAFLSQLICLSCAIRIVRARENDSVGTWQVAIALIAFLTSLSDGLFVLQCVGPLICALFYVWIRGQIPLRRLLCTVAPLLVASCVGLSLTNRVVPNLSAFHQSYSASLSAFTGRQFGAHLDQLVAINRRIFAAAWPVPVLAGVVYTGAFIACVGRWGRKWGGDDSPAFALIASALVFEVPILVIPSLLNNHLNLGERYFLSLYLAPCVLCPAFLAMLRTRMPRLAVQRLAPTVSIAGAVLLVLVLRPFGSWHETFYPREVRMIDRVAAERGLHRGMSTYWLAKYTTMLSRRGIVMAQVASHDLKAFNWIATRRWSRNPVDFVVFDNLPDNNSPEMSQADVRTRLGDPRHVVSGREITIWTYDRGAIPPRQRE